MKLTINDIAREAGVSIATVSNVMNNTGRVSEDTARKVKKIIEDHNYTPNISARKLKNKNSQLISVIVPYLKKGKFEDNPFFWQLLNGVENGAKDQRFNVMLTGVENDHDLTFINKQYLDGIIVIGLDEKTKLFKNIINLTVPCVFMDSYLTGQGIYQVYNNDLMGGYLATKHLLSLGHKKIVIVAGKLAKQGVDYQRCLGYRQALEEADIAYDPNLIMDQGASIAGGYHAAQKIFSNQEKITAVFILSDIGAMGLIRGLNELGLAVPEDISVVGYDDIIYSEYMIPSLTTVRQDIYQKGETAVQLLLDQINRKNNSNGKQIILPVELKIRESTARRE